VAAESPVADPTGAAGPAVVHRSTLFFRAPREPIAIAGILGLSAVLAFVLWYPSVRLVGEGFLLAFAIPALVAAFGTTPLAAALGGRLELRRGVFLAVAVLLLELPIALVWRGALMAWPNETPSVVFLGAFLAGPAVWFRQMSLYGLSRASHRWSLPGTLLQPLLSLLGLFVVAPPSVRVLVATVFFLGIGFLCAVALLRAADRPLQREFQSSGISLIRPLLDHVSLRDPGATHALEGFFAKFSFPADLRVSLLSFFRGGKPYATVALPTVHPGPFAALGASDLPRKLAERLGPGAGTVFVPHTPSDHDLDLPTEHEVAQVGSASREVLDALRTPLPHRASPLVSPYAGSIARAQILGDVALVVVSQAPQPTDDIAFPVADRVAREISRDGGPRLALVDAHNSYVEGQGDITYGTPAAEKLLADIRAALGAAAAATQDGGIEVGVASRGDFRIGEHGIGPQGMQGLVVRAAGRTTGYVLIDGNNLVLGLRDPIVRALERVVDVAEVMTTDNHVVHEVDGGINPVGERRSMDDLTRDAVAVLERAKADLAPAEIYFGSKDVPSVRVLGPGFTARLLTSLGDTLSMFTNMAVATFLLLLMSSLVVTFALK
jgi:putative membrane protein